MKITIESTTELLELVSRGGSVPARVWEGRTESGIPVMCFVTRISPAIPDPSPEQVSQFEEELKECRQPSISFPPIPLRFIL